MDRALLAILLSLTLVTLATLIGYYEGSSWDTISDMITRSDRLRNAFALFVGISVVAQYYYCNEMISRWHSADQQLTLHAYDAVLKFAMLTCFGGAVGFAIVSTDIAERQHMYFAAVSFTGAWLYMSTFYKLAQSHGQRYVIWLHGGTGFYFTMCVSGIALAVQPSWAHYAEYVFVFSLHVTAICFYVLPDQNGRSSMPMAQMVAVIDSTQSLPSPVEFYSNDDNTMQQLRHNGLELTWASHNDILQTFSNEKLSCVTELRLEQNVLIGRGAKGNTVSGNPNSAQIARIKQLAAFYNVPMYSAPQPQQHIMLF